MFQFQNYIPGYGLGVRCMHVISLCVIFTDVIKCYLVLKLDFSIWSRIKIQPTFTSIIDDLYPLTYRKLFKMELIMRMDSMRWMWSMMICAITQRRWDRGGASHPSLSSLTLWTQILTPLIWRPSLLMRGRSHTHTHTHMRARAHTHMLAQTHMQTHTQTSRDIPWRNPRRTWPWNQHCWRSRFTEWGSPHNYKAGITREFGRKRWSPKEWWWTCCHEWETISGSW